MLRISILNDIQGIWHLYFFFQDLDEGMLGQEGMLKSPNLIVTLWKEETVGEISKVTD